MRFRISPTIAAAAAVWIGSAFAAAWVTGCDGNPVGGTSSDPTLYTLYNAGTRGFLQALTGMAADSLDGIVEIQMNGGASPTDTVAASVDAMLLHKSRGLPVSVSCESLTIPATSHGVYASTLGDAFERDNIHNSSLSFGATARCMVIEAAGDSIRDSVALPLKFHPTSVALFDTVYLSSGYTAHWSNANPSQSVYIYLEWLADRDTTGHLPSLRVTMPDTGGCFLSPQQFRDAGIPGSGQILVFIFRGSYRHDARFASGRRLGILAYTELIDWQTLAP